MDKQLFSIGDPSKLFEILRSKMYSDPITSICREITCNARDAHREVNTPELPIQIILPHNDDRYLRIRDFGPGISPDRMQNIYLKYTNTSKENTNQTGGFGLGAKTPFSYSDTFSVVTCVDGIKYHYINYIDDSGIGASFLLDQHPTKESNGTEIVIPILKKDNESFKNSLQEVCKFWSVKPEVIYDNKIIKSFFDEVSTGIAFPEFKGNNWIFVRNNFIKTKHYSYTDKNIEIIMLIDEIPYFLDKSKVNISFLSNINATCIVTIPKNKVTLSSTRESLYYDSSTIDYLQEVIDEIASEALTFVHNKISKALTLKDALGNYIKYKSLFTILNKNVKYKEVYLENLIKYIHGLESKSFTKYDKYIEKSYCDNIINNDNVFVVVNDINVVTTKAHARAFFDHNNLPAKSQVLFIKKRDNKYNETFDEYNKLVEFLYPNKLSDLGKFKKRTESKRRLTFFVSTHGICFNRIAKSEIEKDSNKKIIVNIRKDFHHKYECENYNYNKYISVINSSKEFGFTIYGCNEVLTEDELIDFFEDYYTIEEAIEEIKNQVNESEYIDYLFANDVLFRINKEKYFNELSLYKDSLSYNNSIFKSLEDLKIKVENVIDFKFKFAAGLFYPDAKNKIETSRLANDLNYKPIINKIDEQYPLLKFVKNNSLYDKELIDLKKSISSYIDLINNSSKESE